MVRVTMEGGVNPYGQSDHKIRVFDGFCNKHYIVNFGYK